MDTRRLRAPLRHLERSGRRATLRTDFTWRRLTNRRPSAAYRQAGGHPTGEAARVVADLDRDGIAVSSLEALLDADAADRLFAAADEIRRVRAKDIDEARARLADPQPTVQKPFVVSLLDGHRGDEAAKSLEQFALDRRLLAVAHAYYGMHLTLRYTDIWQNLTTSEPPSQSQLWHRDPEDRLILKVFVALEDVTEGSGPFTYAAGTHAKGTARRRPEFLHRDGPTTRSSDGQMASVVPADRWVTATGPRGTIVFADTRGYHRGGRALETDRVLYVCQYLSLGAGRGGIPTAPA